MCPDRSRRPSAARGMTLIELMIVVAVVALLAAVALPAYQNSVRKARRAEAKAALTTGAQRLERYFTERNSYAGASVGPDPALYLLPNRTEHSHYELSLADVGATTYTFIASPLGDQRQDGCFSFTVNQDGKTGVANGSLTRDDCW